MSQRQSLSGWTQVLQTHGIWEERSGSRTPVAMRFRRVVRLQTGLKGARLWITASQRFVLYLDGKLLARGPARSDPSRWNVQEIRLPALKAGRHVFAVLVWHLGKRAGIGQMGNRPFLLCCGVDRHGRPIPDWSTSQSGWVCAPDLTRRRLPRPYWKGRCPYFPVGGGERFTAAQVDGDWTRLAFDHESWSLPIRISEETASNPWGNRSLEHELQPEPIPPMRETPITFAAGENQFLVAGRSTYSAVLDRGSVTNAYPTVRFSGGNGARVRLVWSESPYNADGSKRRRDDYASARFYGQHDELLLDGRPGQWQPYWFRSFRYLHVTAKTAGQPLHIEGIDLTATEYPLSIKVKPPLKSAEDRRLWDVSFRTAQMCSHETFFDCPHYEQAQFSGDSRVQALYHYTVCDDDRLGRKAIDDMHASRQSEGILQSRFPSQQVQVLPTFSLHWIAMLHDLLMHRRDKSFLPKYLPVAREIIDWFLRHQRPDGLLGRIPHAPFVDWSTAFPAGNAPQHANGGSAILTLMLASACQRMADLEQACGYPELVARWTRTRRVLATAAVQHCWDARRGLIADKDTRASTRLGESPTYSVHGQVEAILAGAVPPARGRAMLQQAATTGVAQPGSFYYRFYLWDAYRACGWGSRAQEFLQPWITCIKTTGLNTWPETERVNPRSDCHAWSILPGLILAGRR